MRVERLTPAHIRRAMRIYLDLAWPADQPGEPRITEEVLGDATSIQELRKVFDHPTSDEGVQCMRFSLRLGNWRYPFMKFVVQEYLVKEEWFFSVDTHDDIKITPDMPDYAGWCELREFNRDLKQRIEDAWAAADLPTHEDLRALMEELARIETGPARTARLVVVDDERDVARGLGAVLEARGYQVQLAYDGTEVLELLADDPLPDLVILDYAMPEMDGEAVLDRLRADERTRDLPVLLATATDIDLAMLRKANGLLRKPFPRELLFRMIEQQLGSGPARTQP